MGWSYMLNERAFYIQMDLIVCQYFINHQLDKKNLNEIPMTLHLCFFICFGVGLSIFVELVF